MSTERDPYVMKHLNTWLEHQVNDDDCREECRTAMLNLFDDDPEYWSAQDWPTLFDRTRCWDIVNRYIARA